MNLWLWSISLVLLFLIDPWEVLVGSYEGTPVETMDTAVVSRIFVQDSKHDLFPLHRDIKGACDPIPECKYETKVAIEVSRVDAVMHLMLGWGNKNMANYRMIWEPDV